jgi:hypothetical protein
MLHDSMHHLSRSPMQMHPFLMHPVLTLNTSNTISTKCMLLMTKVAYTSLDPSYSSSLYLSSPSRLPRIRCWLCRRGRFCICRMFRGGRVVRESRSHCHHTTYVSIILGSGRMEDGEGVPYHSIAVFVWMVRFCVVASMPLFSM